MLGDWGGIRMELLGGSRWLGVHYGWWGMGGGSNPWCGGLYHCYTSAEKSYGGLLMGNCARSQRNLEVT